jgi:hypothetical protein
MATQLAPGLLEIDTKLGGWHHITAGFLVEGASPVLIETGSQSSAPTNDEWEISRSFSS